MSEIALPHGIMLFLGNCTASTSIENEQSVYKWNVGIRFEGDDDRNLKVRRREHRQKTMFSQYSYPHLMHEKKLLIIPHTCSS